MVCARGSPVDAGSKAVLMLYLLAFHGCGPAAGQLDILPHA